MGKNYNSSRLVNGLSVDASGNVGIGGAANASYKLAVTGASLLTEDLRLYRSAATTTGYINFGSTGTNYFGWTGSIFSANGGMTIGGNTGIGISPNTSWGSIFSNSVLQLGNYGSYIAGRADGQEQIFLGTNAYYNGTNWIRTNSTYSARYYISGGAHNFETAASSTAGSSISYDSRMVITNAGNVGIGTSSPTQLLTLGGTASPQMSIVSSSTTGSSEIYFGDSAAVYRGAIIYDHTSDYMTLHTAAAERMRITSGGNVLIGSSNESTYGKLQVTGVIWINFGNYLYTNSRYNGAAAGQLLINNGTGENLSLNETASNRYAFGAGSNGVAITRNVFEMDMSTGACFMKQYGNGTMSISGGQIATSSDKNLKIDDGGIDNALNKVLQLNPRYFYWKEESGIETTERQLGFYAQDVNEALGIEVANDNGNGKWGIYDRALIAMLTKSIQELSAKVTALENANVSLKVENDELRSILTRNNLQ